jgi:Kef-type K+ transport system membrane component KefB
VLKDLGKTRTSEAKIILGAAVIDDVLGLLVLAIISGIITSTNQGKELEIGAIVSIIGLSVGFLLGAILLGRFVSPLTFKLATFLRGHGILMATSLGICFGLSWVAAIIGLAPIVGAFTAGLILDPVHYKDLSKRSNDATIEELIAPLTAVFVPIFFVVMGAKVNIMEFMDVNIIGLAIALTVAAIVGKQVCALGVREKDVDKTVVGLGMIPRGEVGLIFAGIGASLMLKGVPVIDSATYGAVVFMVIVTTMVTPPLIKWRFQK